jgi:hypothetical protein
VWRTPPPAQTTPPPSLTPKTAIAFGTPFANPSASGSSGRHIGLPIQTHNKVRLGKVHCATALSLCEIHPKPIAVFGFNSPLKVSSFGRIFCLCFRILLVFLAMLPFHIDAVKANELLQTEKAMPTQEIVKKIISRNTLPNNFSLVYNYEELENGKWVIREKTKILWDFAQKRTNIFSLSVLEGMSPNIMLVQREVVSKGTSISMTRQAIKNEKKFDVRILDATFERPPRNYHPVAYIEHQDLIAGGSLNTYINLFYTFIGSVPFKETLEKDNKAFDISMKKILGLQESGAIDVTFKKENETMIYTFDNAGVVRRQSFYRKAQKKDGSFTDTRRILFWDIKQSKQFNGFQFPLALEGEIVMSSWLPYEKTIKMRLTVDENSIRVNQDLTDADFLVKIPVGTRVTDKRKGISYESDGLDSELEESLSEALEAVARKAKEKEK